MQQIPRASVHTALQRTPWNFSPEIQLSVEKKKKKARIRWWCELWQGRNWLLFPVASIIFVTLSRPQISQMEHHSFDRYLLSSYYVQGTVLGIGIHWHTKLTKKTKVPVLSELTFNWGVTDKKYNKPVNCTAWYLDVNGVCWSEN